MTKKRMINFVVHADDEKVTVSRIGIAEARTYAKDHPSYKCVLWDDDFNLIDCLQYGQRVEL